MDRRALTLLALDVETSANLLSLLIDSLEERSEADLVATARLALHHVERVARGLDELLGPDPG